MKESIILCRSHPKKACLTFRAICSLSFLLVNSENSLQTAPVPLWAVWSQSMAASLVGAILLCPLHYHSNCSEPGAAPMVCREGSLRRQQEAGTWVQALSTLQGPSLFCKHFQKTLCLSTPNEWHGHSFRMQWAVACLLFQGLSSYQKLLSFKIPVIACWFSY